MCHFHSFSTKTTSGERKYITVSNYTLIMWKCIIFAGSGIWVTWVNCVCHPVYAGFLMCTQALCGGWWRPWSVLQVTGLAHEKVKNHSWWTLHFMIFFFFLSKCNYYIVVIPSPLFKSRSLQMSALEEQEKPRKACWCLLSFRRGFSARHFARHVPTFAPLLSCKHSFYCCSLFGLRLKSLHVT